VAETITITAQDRVDAENLLEQFLGDKVEGDFSKGSALRDLVVTGLANIFAYLQAENDLTRARQSLLLLGRLTGTDVDNAVDEILSNWFISRKQGQYATGVATLYLTQQADVVIPTTAKFYKTGTLVFGPSSTTTTTIAAEDLLPVVDADGTTVAYTVDIALKALLPGSDYNIATGSFVDFTRVSPYLTRVENLNVFAGGGGVETTAALLDRALTAITVRDLNSARSIDTTLKDEFTQVDDVTIIGYGDAEMIRDLILEETTPNRIHVGGCADAYIRGPVESAVYTAEVGAEFTDPRPGYYIFRDDLIIDFTTSTHLKAGDVIRIYNALPDAEADMYIIKEVAPYGLYVSRRAQFPGALPTVIATYTDGILEYDGGSGENRVSSAGEYQFVATDANKTIVCAVAGYTSCVTEDIGKAVIAAPSGDSGTLFSYNNDSRTWIVTPDAPGDVFDIAQTLSITAGTGAGTVESSSYVGKYLRVHLGGEFDNVGTGLITGVDEALNYAVVTGFNYDFISETGVTFSLLSRVVEYSAGSNPPTFNNEIYYAPTYSGMFTKSIQNNGRVLLPEVPIYRITDVSIPGTGIDPTWLSTDGRLHFTNRVNREPIRPTTPVAGNFEYQVLCRNPEEGSSGWQIFELDIAWPAWGGGGLPYPETKTYFNGKTVQVTYETLSGYTSVWGEMLSTDRRIICGSVIPKGLHSVYLSMDIRYRLNRMATADIDTTAAAEALAVYINDFDTREDIDVSDIVWFLRNTYSNIGYIEPFSIDYVLYAPDGRAIPYTTADVVSIDPAKATGGPSYDVLDAPLSIGVSDNTVRYRTAADLITFTNIGS